MMDEKDNLLIPARVRWQCRRGMLELDVLLTSFFENSYETLLPVQQQEFVALLHNTDQTLYEWLIGRTPPLADFVPIIAQIRAQTWKK